MKSGFLSIIILAASIVMLSVQGCGEKPEPLNSTLAKLQLKPLHVLVHGNYINYIVNCQLIQVVRTTSPALSQGGVVVNGYSNASLEQCEFGFSVVPVTYPEVTHPFLNTTIFLLKLSILSEYTPRQSKNSR